ncbi:hypothetical protein KAJ89_03250 [Candidatus Parcubacteria bacterium]|nr:hypothetical protein [Candidatus Parcubacteria bacterium]
MAKVVKKKPTKNKTVKKKPTSLERHKLALKIITENIGNTEKIRRALIDLGYSESYINSGHLKDTDSWNRLMEEKLSDKKLVNMHEKLLNKKAIDFQIFPKSMKDKEITEIIERFGFQIIKISKYESWKRAYFPILDTQAIKAALDMAYKLKKKYGEITVNHKLGELSNEDIEGEIAGAISEALGAIAGKTKKKRK